MFKKMLRFLIYVSIIVEYIGVLAVCAGDKMLKSPINLITNEQIYEISSGQYDRNTSQNRNKETDPIKVGMNQVNDILNESRIYSNSYIMNAGDIKNKTAYTQVAQGYGQYGYRPLDGFNNIVRIPLLEKAGLDLAHKQYFYNETFSQGAQNMNVGLFGNGEIRNDPKGVNEYVFDKKEYNDAVMRTIWDSFAGKHNYNFLTSNCQQITQEVNHKYYNSKLPIYYDSIDKNESKMPSSNVNTQPINTVDYRKTMPVNTINTSAIENTPALQTNSIQYQNSYNQPDYTAPAPVVIDKQNTISSNNYRCPVMNYHSNWR